MSRNEFLAFFADATFAENKKLATVLKGGDEGGPFFEGYLAGFGQGIGVVLHVIYVSTCRRGSQLGGGWVLRCGNGGVVE